MHKVSLAYTKLFLSYPFTSCCPDSVTFNNSLVSRDVIIYAKILYYPVLKGLAIDRM